jgi:sugar lactone lactonase YvrE
VVGGTEVLVGGLAFPESPRWHEGRLWFSDFFDRVVAAIEPDGSMTIEAAVPEQPSGLGWLPDGRLLVASRLDRRILRLEADGALVEHANLAPVATGDVNDMLVDDVGRAYVGNLGFDPHTWFREGRSFADIPGSTLARVDPDGTVHAAATDLRVPNGTVLTLDGRLLLVAESFASRVVSFEVDPSDGSLSNRETWAPMTGRTPDGIALDAEGCLWVADARRAECVRISKGGDILQVVATTQSCFACTLGGASGRTLFCLTAPSTGEADTLAARRGRIEVSPVDVPAM